MLRRDLDGETVAVVSLFASQIRPISQREVTHARKVGSEWQKPRIGEYRFNGYRPLFECACGEFSLNARKE